MYALKYMKYMKYLALWCCAVFPSSQVMAQAQQNHPPIKIALAYAPSVTSKLSDPFPTYFKKMAELAGKEASIRISPLMRTLMAVADGSADLQAPYIHNPAITTLSHPFEISSATFWKLNFVLYTHKGKVFDNNNLARMKLVTNRGWTDIIGFKVGSLTKVEASLRMVNAGRIDGVIYADVVVDPMIKRLGLKNVRRTFFGTFDVKAAIAKNSRSKEIDAMISNAVEKLQGSKEIKALTSNLSSYDNWQPYELLK